MNLSDTIPYRYWCNKCQVEHYGRSGIGKKHYLDPTRDAGLQLKMGDRITRSDMRSVSATFIYYPRYNSMTSRWGSVAVLVTGETRSTTWRTELVEKCPINIDDNGNLV